MGFEIKGGDVEMRTDHEFRVDTREDKRDRQEERRKTDAEREHVDDLVVGQRNLLRDVIKAQAKGGYKG